MFLEQRAGKCDKSEAMNLGQNVEFLYVGAGSVFGVGKGKHSEETGVNDGGYRSREALVTNTGGRDIMGYGLGSTAQGI